MAVRVALDRREQLGAEDGVVLRLVGRLVLGERDEDVLDEAAVAVGRRSCGRAPPRAAPLPRTARRAGRAGPLPSLRRSSSRQVAKQVGPGLDGELPAPDAVDLERAGPAVAVHLAVDPAHRRLAATPRRPARGSGARPRISWPSRKTSADDLDPLADRPLDREAAAVDHRGRVQDLDARRRRAVVRPREDRPVLARAPRAGARPRPPDAGSRSSDVRRAARRRRAALEGRLPGTVSGVGFASDRGMHCGNPHEMDPSTRSSTAGPRVRSSGVQLHPTSLPGGRLGDEAYRFVDWLAAAGQTWWQMLPLGPPARAARRTSRRRRSPRRPSCWPSPTRR